MQRPKGTASPRAAWETFTRERDVHGVVAGCAFLSSAGLLYLAVAWRNLATSVPLDTVLSLAPLVILALVAIAAGVFGTIHAAGKHAIVGGARRVVLVAGSIAVVASAAASFLLAMQGAALINTVAVTAVVALVASVASLLAGTGMTAPALAKTIEPPHAGEPLPFKVLLGRAMKYCAARYWKLLVTFVIVQVVMKLVRLLVMVPWGSALLREELFLVDYLRDHNYIAGMLVDPDIMNRARALVIWQNVHFIVNDAFQSTFYFATVGLAVYLLVKTYRGADPTLSQPFQRDWRVLAKLIGLSFLFSIVYHALLMILVVPGILFYAYCIMVFPNLLVIKKYRFFENFGKAKDLLKDNFWRVIGYVLLIFLVRFAANYPASAVMGALQASAGGPVTTQAWLLAPAEHFGELFVLEAMEGMLGAFIGPLEAAIIAMLFIDLQARQRAAKAKPVSSSPGDRREALKNLPLADRIKKARYCPTCGLSVRSGLTRCPNCKAVVAE